MILSELWKILCVIGMIAGIGFCAVCILMCILIGVMVIRACMGDDSEMQDTQPRQVSKEKTDSGTQVNDESEEKWSDREEKESEDKKVWLVREKDGTWVKKNGKPMYVKVDEDEEQMM